MSSMAVSRTIVLAVIFVIVFMASPGAEAAKGKSFGAGLPSLLKFADGREVKTAKDWQGRRAEIKRLMEEHFVGAAPDEVPAIIASEILKETQAEDGSRRIVAKLTFNTKNKVSFEMQVWLPKGEGPFPVLLVAPANWQLKDKKTGRKLWPGFFVKNGYAVCLFPGLSDPEGDWPGYDKVWEKFRGEYPKATWTKMRASAWIASRAVDYLLDPKYGYPIKKDQVGMVGHSRYGKLTLITMAFDERFTAGIVRSSGSPGVCAYRFTSLNTFNEAPQFFQKDWFLESLKGYTGREDELPIDSHGWLALIAPRNCQMHTAHQDYCEPTFAVEMSYLQGKKVYELLGASGNLFLRYRQGTHNPVTDEHLADNLKWFNMSFAKSGAKSDFPEELVHYFDFEAWKANLSAEDVKVPFASPVASDDPADKKARINWALGQEPEKIEWSGEYSFLSDYDLWLMSNDQWRTEDTDRIEVGFGKDVRGNVYFSKNQKEAAPAVIFLHPYSYSTGYNGAYGVDQGITLYWKLAQQGYVILAYDQVGFGIRLLEGPGFYKKYPKWSRLGRMVYDLRSAVDFLADGKGKANGAMPKVDKDRIYVLGYSLGGMVGLYGAAMDERITGVASFSGFTPLRTDTDAKSTGGIRRFWQWHALQPMLGLFNGKEQQIPYDYDDVLELIAPRPCLVVSPTRDRDNDFDEVVACVDKARKAMAEKGKAGGLVHKTPDDISRLQIDNQFEIFNEWLKADLQK